VAGGLSLPPGLSDERAASPTLNALLGHRVVPASLIPRATVSIPGRAGIPRPTR
jgi:hypothetical protein